MTQSERPADDEGVAAALTWRDYLAILAALGRTVLLPFLLALATLLVLLVVVLL